MDENYVRESVLELFPNEILVKIFANIEDFKELLGFRFVSKDVKGVADEILKRNSSMWKRTFDDYNFSTFIERVKGTRFTTDGNVEEFLEDMEETAWNPFPNGTVVFFPSYFFYDNFLGDSDRDDRKLKRKERRQIDDYYDSFETLVDSEFSDDITGLVYAFKHDSDEDEISHQLECILKLKNLKHLAVLRASERLDDDDLTSYLAHDKEAKKTWVKGSTLNNVQELMIFGRHSNADVIIGVPACIRALCAAVSKNCQRLQFCSVDSAALTTENQAGDVVPLVSFPKLECLKVLGPLEHDCEDNLFVDGLIPATLEEFSFRHLQDWIIEGPELASTFPDVLNNINRQAMNLRVFHLRLEDGFLDEPFDLDLGEDNAQLQFPNVTHALLGYGSLQKMNLENYLKQKLPNLRELTILARFEENVQEVHKLIMTLFPQLPASLESIHFPRSRWTVTRDGSIKVRINGFAEYE